MPWMFLNGEGMYDGPAHHHIAGSPLVRKAATAPRYRYFCFHDRFPGLLPVDSWGASIHGELYDVPMDRLYRLVSSEPPELELSIVELDDGSLSFAMVVREGEHARDGVVEITEHGGWRAYHATKAQ